MRIEELNLKEMIGFLIRFFKFILLVLQQPHHHSHADHGDQEQVRYTRRRPIGIGCIKQNQRKHGKLVKSIDGGKKKPETLSQNLLRIFYFLQTTSPR